ncbi:hypothetical protein GCM10022223_19220 [Kineosporia mesophila]|uniref:Uncharacterized protein n=1 Tax=Kineosporia mesophila TaxID=566012 RepID=A0ABP6ZBP0_9ACTN
MRSQPIGPPHSSSGTPRRNRLGYCIGHYRARDKPPGRARSPGVRGSGDRAGTGAK